MSSIAQQESLVKESLFQFVTKNIPSADLNVIDEIVLSYVISILEEASQDPCFDVEGFVEMMSAYFPEFSDIDQAAVCSWIFELEAEINGGAHGVTNDVESYADKLSLSLSEMLPPINQKGNRSHSSSESSDSTGRGRRSWSDCGQESSLSELCFPEECQLVAEMFPNICLMEIKTCMIIANGDIHLATQILLHRQENGQSLSNSAALLNMTVGANRNQQIDDAELKNRIIARYSYVDKNSDTKEHKPLAPRIEPKKLVRYRDNKIVSLKGERYTEVPKSGADEDQLKKPKKQHCP